MKILENRMIRINQLYPTASLFSIAPERIKELTHVLKKDGTDTEIIATEFDGHYYIVDGHEQVAAASFLGAEKVMVYLIDYKEHAFFSKPGNLENTLSSIGMTAIYDFEAICGITYGEYPLYYKTK